MQPWSETLQLSKPLINVMFKGDPRLAERAANDRALRDSYERGRRDAETALSQQLLQQRNEIHDILRGVVESLRGSVPQIVRDSEDAMISLALSVAQKLVCGLTITAEMVEATVRDALAQIENSAQFTVRLNPADLELLEKCDSPLLKEGDGVKEFRFVPSADVTRGGCLVLTQFGTVDARLETKFDLLQRTLTE